MSDEAVLRDCGVNSRSVGASQQTAPPYRNSARGHKGRVTSVVGRRARRVDNREANGDTRECGYELNLDQYIRRAYKKVCFDPLTIPSFYTTPRLTQIVHRPQCLKLSQVLLAEAARPGAPLPNGLHAVQPV